MIINLKVEKMNFESLLERFHWLQYEDYIKKENIQITHDIDSFVEAREKFRNKVLSIPNISEKLFQIEDKKLKNAFNSLRKGEVCGIDGTLALYPTPIGYRCRIGVVAVNYKGERVNEAVYISDANLVDEELEKVEDFLENVEKLTRITPLLYRSIMFHRERELALERQEKWKLAHGPLIPLEMRLGRLGVSGALEANLELSKKIVEHGHVIGVLSSTNRLRVLNLGYALNPGEYMKIASLGSVMESEIRRAPSEERELILDFIREYGEKLVMGIYKASHKAYVFEAREDVFHEAAHILYADSLNNPVKGFPLLIDYADTLCSSLLSPEDFKKRIECEILKREKEKAFQSIDERRMRWRR
ncbi:MAG: hypothetical protein DRJ39_03700 [Thermoprotei archaeon]|nr:MAG: hypothetical protein DRJ39_03700 [Thermoprotei archaeon]